MDVFKIVGYDMFCDNTRKFATYMQLYRPTKHKINTSLVPVYT